MLGFEVSPVIQYVIAFAIIAILLALFAIVLKRIGGKRFAMGSERGRGRQPRLGIVDVYDLDRQRQLVLLRRDNVEHLVMLGGPNDCVIESNIVRAPHGRTAAPPVAETPFERGPEQAIQGQPAYPPGLPQATPPAAHPQAMVPQAMVPQAMAPQAMPPQSDAPAAGLSLAAAAQTQPVAPAPRPPEPTLDTTQPLHAPEPEIANRPEQKRGLFGFGRASETEAGSKAVPQFPPRPRTTPVAPEIPPPYPPRRATPPLPDPLPEGAAAPPRTIPGADMATALPAGTRAAGTASPETTPTEPALMESAPTETFAAEGTADKAASVEVSTAAPKPPEPAPPPRQQARPPAGREDALLSDMARELEAAFKRPASGPVSDPGRRDPEPASAAAQAPVPEGAAAQTPVVDEPVAGPAGIPPFPTRSAPPVEDASSGPTGGSFSFEEAFAQVVPDRFKPTRSPPSQPSPETPPPGIGPVDASSEQPAPEMTPAPGAPHAAAPGMTPPPASGPARFAAAIEEFPQAQAAPEPDARTDTETPPLDLSQAEPPAPSSAFVKAQEVMAEEALAEEAEAKPALIPEEDAGTTEASAAKAEPELEQSAQPASQNAFAGNDQAITAIPDTAAPQADMPVPDDADNAVTSDQAVADTHVAEETRPASTIDPFSVDEIEAEFARLLGRSADKDPKSS